VREASTIINTNSVNKKELSKIKTHEEILDLLEEIDLIEEKIKKIDKFDETSNEQSYSENDIINSDNLSESLDELEFIEISNENLDDDGELIFTEVPTNSELNELIRKKDKEKVLFKNGLGQKKLHFKIRRRKKNEISGSLDELDLSKTNNFMPKKSTFTIRISNKGELIGLNIKKPKIKSQNILKRFHFLKNEKNKETSSEESVDKTNIFRKIFGKLARIKLKTPEGETSRLSNVLSKIKGIFSRS
jgi:hypothetical protein